MAMMAKHIHYLQIPNNTLINAMYVCQYDYDL